MPAEPEPKLQRVYWDSCVVLSFLEGTPDRIGELDEIVREQRDKQIEIVTSVISRAEIIYVAGMDDDESIKAIDQLWTPESPITPVEVFDQITAEAQDLVRHQRSKEWKKLTPLDAIHVASAARYADKMQTYDESLHRYNNVAGIQIGFPEAVQPQLSPQSSSE
jgi:predicted nucleic acid-binding protein